MSKTVFKGNMIQTRSFQRNNQTLFQNNTKNETKQNTNLKHVFKRKKKKDKTNKHTKQKNVPTQK